LKELSASLGIIARNENNEFGQTLIERVQDDLADKNIDKLLTLEVI